MAAKARDLVAVLLVVSRSFCPPPLPLLPPPLTKSAAGQKNTDERQPLALMNGNSLKHNWVSWRNAEGCLVIFKRQQPSSQGGVLLSLLSCSKCFNVMHLCSSCLPASVARDLVRAYIMKFQVAKKTVTTMMKTVTMRSHQ